MEVYLPECDVSLLRVSPRQPKLGLAQKKRKTSKMELARHKINIGSIKYRNIILKGGKNMKRRISLFKKYTNM